MEHKNARAAPVTFMKVLQTWAFFNNITMRTFFLTGAAAGEVLSK
jgi:hypothetical protein